MLTSNAIPSELEIFLGLWHFIRSWELTLELPGECSVFLADYSTGLLQRQLVRGILKKEVLGLCPCFWTTTTYKRV